MRAAAIVATSTGNWDGGPQRDRLIAAAHTVLSNCGVQMSWTKVRRTVQMYERQAQRNGLAFDGYIAQVAVGEHQRRVVADELRRVTEYVDKPARPPFAGSCGVTHDHPSTRTAPRARGAVRRNRKPPSR